MAPENHAGFAMVAVYQKPNKYSDGFPYSSTAEMMSCCLSVCIYCIQMYIEKRLLGIGGEVAISSKCGFHTPNISDCLTVVPDFIAFFLCCILTVVPGSFSQCYFLRRVGMVILRLKNIHPECEKCVENKVVLSLTYREK